MAPLSAPVIVILLSVMLIWTFIVLIVFWAKKIPVDSTGNSSARFEIVLCGRLFGSRDHRHRLCWNRWRHLRFTFGGQPRLLSDGVKNVSFDPELTDDFLRLLASFCRFGYWRPLVRGV